ncbi:LPS export ABC transporter permease LptF [Tistrella bauzanensis]|uniref:LPS export ABC transporter permease LptF n=1 Tax=Tistrella bauzanensis TaxID=657419 RepID=A0ABQ1ISA0_9PROT|nr:LPS export ABC transporter permease LptF [Tistrella bauzanensis]GGB50692.1 LPS export ABC transporter permease LptF [Tistrella bauzanensis]
MPLASRYLFRQLLLPALAITMGLVAVVWLTQSVRFLDLIVNRGLSAFTFVKLTILLLPTFLSIIMPIALFCAVIAVYSRLISDRELVVMQAAGLGPWALIRPAVALAVGFTLFGYVLSSYLVPVFARDFRELQLSIRSDVAAVLLQEGRFNTPVSGLTVFVRERLPSGELAGILVQDERDRDLPVTMMAARGGIVPTETGQRIVLVDGNRQERSGDGRVSFLYFDRYTVDLALVAGDAAPTIPDRRERFIGELLTPEEGLPPKFRAELRGELHQRLAWPLYNIAFTLIALGPLLSGEFSRRSRWTRVAVATVAMIVVQLTGLTLTSAVVTSPTAAVPLYLIIIGASVVALGLMLRPQIRHIPATPPQAGQDGREVTP